MVLFIQASEREQAFVTFRKFKLTTHSCARFFRQSSYLFGCITILPCIPRASMGIDVTVVYDVIFSRVKTTTNTREKQKTTNTCMLSNAQKSSVRWFYVFCLFWKFWSWNRYKMQNMFDCHDMISSSLLNKVPFVLSMHIYRTHVC